MSQDIVTMTDRFVVIGNPIKHSLSPAIHADFARQTGASIQYRRWLSPLNGFERTVSALQAAGVVGANVTVPFKHEAAQLATEPSPEVQFSGAANTLKFKVGGGFQAFNTDGEGLCQDLSRLLAEQGLALSGVHVLMLGAGGAAKGCISAFKSHGVAHLTVLN
ncbi:MAG: shikimate dehydrogenase, partial [Limnobacter sp.]|nr:shikimate dehydrogenase [Limnobacter sp.]